MNSHEQKDYQAVGDNQVVVDLISDNIGTVREMCREIVVDTLILGGYATKEDKIEVGTIDLKNIRIYLESNLVYFEFFPTIDGKAGKLVVECAINYRKMAPHGSFIVSNGFVDYFTYDDWTDPSKPPVLIKTGQEKDE